MKNAISRRDVLKSSIGLLHLEDIPICLQYRFLKNLQKLH